MSIGNRVASPRPAFGRAGGNQAAPPRPAAPAERSAPASAASSAASNPFAAASSASVVTRESVATAEQFDRLEIGRVVNRAFTALWRNAVTFLALTALAAAPERIAVHMTGMDSRLAPSVSAIAVGLFGIALKAAVIQGALDDFQGRAVTFGRCLETALRTYFPVLAISMLASAGIAAGMILLVVPGLLLALSWSVVLAVRVAENKSIDACFGRSAALARGHRGSIFLLGLMLVLLIVPLGLALAPLWGIPLSGVSGFLMTNWLLRFILMVISGAGVAALYYELRMVKEGGATEDLAVSFD